jgi:hypothetical protein
MGPDYPFYRNRKEGVQTGSEEERKTYRRTNNFATLERGSEKMNSETFNKIVEDRCEAIKKTLIQKGKEYASDDDRLYNFKRQSEMNRQTPQEAARGNWTKHLVSVMDLIEGRIEPTEYLLNEKIGDSINYLILIESLFKEKKVNMKCLECGECSNSKI